MTTVCIPQVHLTLLVDFLPHSSGVQWLIVSEESLSLYFQSLQCEYNFLGYSSFLNINSVMQKWFFFCLELFFRVIFNTLFGLSVKYWMAITTRLLLGALNGMLAPIKVPQDAKMASFMPWQLDSNSINMFVTTLIFFRLTQSRFVDRNTMLLGYQL